MSRNLQFSRRYRSIKVICAESLLEANVSRLCLDAHPFDGYKDIPWHMVLRAR